MTLYEFCRRTLNMSPVCVYDILNVDGKGIVLKDVYLYEEPAKDDNPAGISLRYAKTGELAKESDTVIMLLIDKYFKPKLKFWPYPLVLPIERRKKMCMTITEEVEISLDSTNYIKRFMKDNDLEPGQPFYVDDELYVFDKNGTLTDVTNESETQQGYYDRLDTLMALLTGEKKVNSPFHMLLSRILRLKPNTKYRVISVANTARTGVAVGSCIGGVEVEGDTEKIVSHNPHQCNIKDIVYYLLKGWFAVKEVDKE